VYAGFWFGVDQETSDLVGNRTASAIITVADIKPLANDSTAWTSDVGQHANC